MKILIGLFAISGIMIFLHSQELKNQPQEDLLQQRLERIQKLNSMLDSNKSEEIRIAKKLCSNISIQNLEEQECNHSYCKMAKQFLKENDQVARP